MWHSIFHLPLPVLEKILRPLLVYGFLVIVLRVIGKRELGQSNTMDLVVLLLVANAVQNGIIGNEVSVTGAVIGAVTLFAVNEGLSRLAYNSPRIEKLLAGETTALIKDGRPVAQALRRWAISLPELRSIARRQGYEDLGEIETAYLEPNGIVTMFKKGEPQVYHPAEPGGLRLGKRRRARLRG